MVRSHTVATLPEVIFSRTCRAHISTLERPTISNVAKRHCPGHTLCVIERSARCDLSHQVVQSAEIQGEETFVASLLVLGRVDRQRFWRGSWKAV